MSHVFVGVYVDARARSFSKLHRLVYLSDIFLPSFLRYNVLCGRMRGWVGTWMGGLMARNLMHACVRVFACKLVCTFTFSVMHPSVCYAWVCMYVWGNVYCCVGIYVTFIAACILCARMCLYICVYTLMRVERV